MHHALLLDRNRCPFSGCGFSGYGIRGDNFIRPGRQYPPGTIRPPFAGNTPAVATVTGFGTGSGATVTQRHGIADVARGTVAIRVGSNPLPSGSLTLSFPAGVATGQYVFAADWATLTPSIATPNAILSWTATAPLVPGTTLLLTYELATMV